MRFARHSSRRHGAGGQGPHFDSKQQRKLRQLCRQVHRALMYAVPGDMADPMLQDLFVEAVEPAPDASRLMVRLASSRPPGQAPEILERLSRVAGHLRGEVAAAITRKRAPELVFALRFTKEVGS
ncbi:MAG TPA: hypothetical protein VN541_03695 [Tepidisphaeraceae bacterium]|nr:hypothetical protein [Tepidisphaeraceae bacterium]